MMRWDKEGHVHVSHPRERWQPHESREVTIHCRYDFLKGTNEALAASRPKLVAAYSAAKTQFNMSAGFEVVERCIDPAKYERIAELVIGAPVAPRLILPHPAFDDEEGDITGELTNALPFAYAGYLRARLGCPLDEEIVQEARIGRTKLNTFLRFLCQPSFRGDVRPNEPYIILDDVMTTGGTCAALRSYILRKGGTVAFATALAHREGRDQLLGVADDTVSVLQLEFGKGLDRYWLEAIGHDISCLTESEAKFLVQWAQDQRREGAAAGDELLQRLRDRIDAAAAKGS